MNFITRNVSNLKLMNFGSSFPFDWLRPSSKMLQPEISLFRTFHWGWPRREKAPRNFQEISIMFLSFLSFAFEFAFVAKVFLLTEAVHKHTHTQCIVHVIFCSTHSQRKRSERCLWKFMTWKMNSSCCFLLLFSYIFTKWRTRICRREKLFLFWWKFTFLFPSCPTF